MESPIFLGYQAVLIDDNLVTNHEMFVIYMMIHWHFRYNRLQGLPHLTLSFPYLEPKGVYDPGPTLYPPPWLFLYQLNCFSFPKVEVFPEPFGELKAKFRPS